MVSSSLSGAMFHGYIIRELIGRGGCAEVYRVSKLDDPDHSAALKVLRADQVGIAAQVKRLADEYQPARAAARSRASPRPIVAGEMRGRAGLLMEFMPGPNLTDAIRDRATFSPAPAILGLVRIAAYLHRQGVVHADLKLDNGILRPDGSVALVDFGNARSSSRASLFVRFFRRAATCHGTAAYIAPEVITGHQPSPASDVYSLAICIHLLLTGMLPFASASSVERIAAHLRDAPISITVRMPQLPRRMRKAIDAALDKVPMNRPQDANSLLDALSGLDQVGDMVVRASDRTTRTFTRVLLEPGRPGSESPPAARG